MQDEHQLTEQVYRTIYAFINFIRQLGKLGQDGEMRCKKKETLGYQAD